MHYLLDLWSTLSYVTFSVVLHFCFNPKCILDSVSISILVSDYVVARRVYRGFLVFVGGRETLVDLFKLYMFDIDVILGIDWCYDSLDYRARKVIVKFHNELNIEWEGNSLAPKGMFILYLGARKLISK